MGASSGQYAKEGIMASFRASSSGRATLVTCAVRSYSGPWGMEVWAHIVPEDEARSVREQAESMESQLDELLSATQGSPEHIVRQTFLVTDTGRDVPVVLQVRRGRASCVSGAARVRAPLAFLKQQPLEPQTEIATIVQLFVPKPGRPCAITN